MKDDNETKSKLLASAKQEFIEKGYMSASLRNICKNAGVTTGALYFFFKDKEDVFAALVEEPLNMLYTVMKRHYEEEIELINRGQFSKENEDDDTEVGLQLIHYMYQHYDEFQLVLTKAQGSKFEKCIDDFVQITEKHYRVIADKMSKQLQWERIDDYIIHWISHMQIDTFVHMITHETSEEAACSHMKVAIEYLINGWYALFGITNRKELKYE